jgi:Zn-dependent membrane protease YugP
MYNIDITYMIISVVGLALSLGAQAWVKLSVGKWQKVSLRRPMSGAQIAELILKTKGISGVRVETVGGFLSDHYDPTSRTLRLSPDIYNGMSVASAGIAAHEVGHAIQHAEGYMPMSIRQKLVPVANIGTQFGVYMIMIGMAINFLGLAKIGVLLFGAFVAFQLVTLPVELDASSRAKKALAQSGMLQDDELAGVSSVLTAAAATYLASALTALMQLLYFLSRLNGRNRD